MTLVEKDLFESVDVLPPLGGPVPESQPLTRWPEGDDLGSDNTSGWLNDKLSRQGLDERDAGLHEHIDHRLDRL